MEEDELLDSELLERTVLDLISQGKRNFSIDLSGLDYLYSDSMNKLLGLNRKVLDVNGRLSLLGPNEEVRQIIERAGIHNFIKIYNDEEELARSAEEIIKQTTSFSVADLQRYREQAGEQPQAKPESEFEDLRSELGGAFALGDDDSGDETPSYGAQQAAPPQAPAEEQFEFGPSAPPPPPRRPEPQQRRPDSSPSFDYSQPPQQQSGYAPPSGPPRAVPTPPPQSRQQPPSSSYHQPPQAPAYQPPEPSRRPPPQQKPGAMQQDGRADRFERDLFDEEEKKKSPVGMILVLLIVLAALGGGGWYAYENYIKPNFLMPGTPEAEETVTQPAEPEVPQLAVEQDSTAEDTVSEAEEEVEEKEEPEKVARATSTRRSRPTPRRSRPEPRRSVSRPAPQPPQVTNKLTITSSPAGAAVTIDGDRLGTTPYTWEDPSVYGSVLVQVSRSGYETAKRTVDYTGGTKSEHFTLDKEPERAPPPPPPEPEPEPEPEPVASRAAPSTPSTSSSSPPPAPKPTPKPSPPASSGGGGGSPGSIFIASIPPVADVYMDGKKIGQTNIAELKVTAGTHTMRFVKGGKEITKEMTFKAGKNPSQMVKIP